MKPCCEDLSNRAEGPGPRGWVGIEGLEERDDVAVTHCTVCDARHVEATADPHVMKVRGAISG
jgi:hypothetical protein